MCFVHQNAEKWLLMFWEFLGKLLYYYRPPLHQQMHLETLLCKEKAIHQLCAAMLPSSLSSPQMALKTVRMCAVVRGVFVLGRPVLHAEGKGTIQIYLGSAL